MNLTSSKYELANAAVAESDAQEKLCPSVGRGCLCAWAEKFTNGCLSDDNVTNERLLLAAVAKKPLCQCFLCNMRYVFHATCPHVTKCPLAGYECRGCPWDRAKVMPVCEACKRTIELGRSCAIIEIRTEIFFAGADDQLVATGQVESEEAQLCQLCAIEAIARTLSVIREMIGVRNTLSADKDQTPGGGKNV